MNAENLKSALDFVNWKIETEKKSYDSAKSSLEHWLKEKDYKLYNTEFIVTYANQMNDAAVRLDCLLEQKRTLESIAED